jgi:hypothetical protein
VQFPAAQAWWRTPQFFDGAPLPENSDAWELQRRYLQREEFTVAVGLSVVN